MTQVGAPRHDPVPIGEVSSPPFARAPEPRALFAERAARLRTLAEGHKLAPYLQFVAGLADLQHAIQDDLPPVEPPAAEVVARAREFGMPPLDRSRFTADAACDATLDRLFAAAETLTMPPRARSALAHLGAVDPASRAVTIHNVLADAIPIETLAEHVFVATALQVHFARLAETLDARRLVPVGDGACPACGGAPVASAVVGWHGAHGARFCICALCATWWNYVRIKCAMCASTKGIGYQAIDGGPGTIKAETCSECRSYLKIFYQDKDPSLDPVADDIASLDLDLLVRQDGLRRGGVNPFLIGY